MDCTRFTLDNGLRVVCHHDPRSAMVAVNLLYDVGSRDESPELTGMAHLFEHLMFGGSVNVADFDGALELAGGSNNAWTSDDFTNFWDLVPASNVETAFWLESDRMLSLAFSPQSLEVQRQVVLEEFKQVCLNRPYGDLMHRLREMLYTVHPYRYPTIGKEPSHIEKVTMEDVKQFFYSHYAPNNAVLAVAGNTTPERVRELAEKWFAPIPYREVAKRKLPVEPAPEAAREAEVESDVPQVCIVMAFPMAAYGADGYVEADMISDILSSGRASRFFRRLVMGCDLFTDVDASISGIEDPGYFIVTARLRENTDEAIEAATKAIRAELDKIMTEDVTDEEIERAKNRYESNYTFNQLNIMSKAQSMAMAELHGEELDTMLGRYLAVTKDDVRRIATDVLRRERCCKLVYRPKKK